MGLVAARIAGAEGAAVVEGAATVLEVVVTQEAPTYGILAVGGDAPAFTVDWGDGSSTTAAAAGSGVDRFAGLMASGSRELVHTYARPGTYKVRVDGRATWFASSSYSEAPGMSLFPAYETYAKRLRSVEKWGENMFARALPTSAVRLAALQYASAFTGCSNLQSLAPRAFPSIEARTFAGCTSLSSPDRVVGSGTVVQDWAFAYSSFANTSWWPYGQTTVPDYCFYKSAVASVSAMGSVTEAGQFAFSETALTSLDGLESVLEFKASCFAGCASLVRMGGQNSDDLTPTDSLSATTLGVRCFKDCVSLASLTTFPHHVTVIPQECFSGCVGLGISYKLVHGYTVRVDHAIYIPGHVCQIHRLAFDGVGASQVTFGEPAFYNSGTQSRAATYANSHASLTGANALIDRAAFFGQKESSGVASELVIDASEAGFTLAELKAIPGRDIGESEYNASASRVVKYRTQGASSETSWFSHYSPTWAPWGLSQNWRVAYASNGGRQLTGVDDLVSDSFKAAPGSIPWSGGATRLSALEAAPANHVYVSPNFSPYESQL